MLERALVLGAFPSRTGIYGLTTSRDIVRALMRLEPMLNAVNVNFVTSSNYLGAQQRVKGEIFAISVIAPASAEAAIGPAIVLAMYRNARSIRTDQFNSLRWQ
uniref:NAD(P)H-quinone oxidoreductase subunit 4L, chloroplastic n=1 Tax=Selaginella remotifolia TaxID=137170 RepID=A0A482CNC8_SELRE|nr:NADH-plastoquinone oxidoreductase subunit 4L [Selaginella remotifolia]QBL76301.1 NADH-plastoquinone oxidoreductase subunit 4L [Selaginella remotifolia]